MLAIDFMHSKYIVHRDLKLANILLNSNEEGVLDIRIADFGLAKKLKPGQFISEKIIIDPDIKEPRLTITKLYNDFRIWCASNVIKSKKCPDRNQLKAYFEKLLSVPYDNKGWRGIAYKLEDNEENEDDN